MIESDLCTMAAFAESVMINRTPLLLYIQILARVRKIDDKLTGKIPCAWITAESAFLTVRLPYNLSFIPEFLKLFKDE